MVQPSTDGEKLYFRSSEAADIAPLALSITGDVGGTSTTEANDLHLADGRVEKETTAEFEDLQSVRLSGPCAGDVTIYGQGTAAGGRVTVNSRPVDGETLRISLSGFTEPTVTLARMHEAYQFYIRCEANVAGSLDGTYFDLVDASGAVRVCLWSTTVGAPPSTPLGGRLLDVVLGGANVDVFDVATAIATELEADVFTANIPGRYLFIGLAATSALDAYEADAGTSGFGVDTLNRDTTGTYAAAAGQMMIGTDAEETAKVINAQINGTEGVLPEWTITVVADSGGALNQTFLLLPTRFGTLALWMSNDEAAAPPADALAADFECMVQFTNDDGASTIAGLVRDVLLSLIPFFSAASAVSSDVTLSGATCMPLSGHSEGDSGFTIVQNEDGAYGGGAGDGTWFLIDEDAPTNPYVSGTVSGAVVTLTDRIACARALGWTMIQTVGTSLTLEPMIGGQDGEVLVRIPAGETHIFDPIVLETHDLGEDTLPALLAPTLEPVYIGSSAAELWFKITNITNPIAVKYQVTNDPSLANWIDGANAIANLDNYPVSAPLRVTVAERAEWIRLVITANTNNVGIPLDARVNFPS